jgi:hypothetical protein
MEDQDKYSDETVWKRYVGLATMELKNIIDNPRGGGKNYITPKETGGEK